jgi:hypothetical protein
MAKVNRAPIPVNLEDEIKDDNKDDEDVLIVENSAVKGVYATEYFKRNNIPHCKKCGEQYHTGTEDEPVCPENFPANVCPRLGI